MARRLAGSAAVLASAVVLCACGNGRPTASVPSSSTQTSAVSPPSTTSASSQASGCVSAQLAVELGQAGVAAGSVASVVSFKNTSSTECSLYGYPGLQMLDAAGQPFPTEVIRGTSATVPSVPENVVTLAPSAEASFDLGYADGTGYGSASCPTSPRVEITPPNADQSITVAWQIQPYGGGTIAQLQCGQITVSPVYAGNGAPGST
jgi:hypothetical protein